MSCEADTQNQALNSWKAFWKAYPTEFVAQKSLEKVLGYTFNHKPLLYEALTHRSAVTQFNQMRRKRGLEPLEIPWYQRFEFLGDSILGAVIATQIFAREPNYLEGQLSQLRSQLVNEGTLAAIAREIDLGSAIAVTSHQPHSADDSSQREGLLADILEAVIAAIYLDSDFKTAEKIINKLFAERLSDYKKMQSDYKSEFQELMQGQGLETPTYALLSSSGPDHQKTFEVGVYVGAQLISKGHGTTKRKASQEAAQNALHKRTQL